MSVAEDQTLYSELDEEPREAFAAFVCDDETHSAAVALAGRRGWPKGEVQHGGMAAALRQLGVVAAPEIMLIDVSDASEPAQALDGLSELAGEARVLAVGTQNDVGLFRQMLEAGAADYLVKPVTAEALDEAVKRIEQAGATGQAPTPARRGRCIAFVGARGGVGATTLAANIAWMIAEERERRVGLIDLDLQFGTLALSFDVEAGPGLREALEDPDRVDELFLSRAMTSIGERLSVLASEEPVDDAPHVVGQAVPKLLESLRERSDLLILDVPRSLLASHPDVLEQVTDVVVVSDLTLAGLRDSNRLLRFLKAQGGKVRTHVVTNRVGKALKGQIEASEFARELEGDMGRQITLDSDSMAKAAMQGKPLGESVKNGKLLKDMRALTVDLVGEPRRRRKSLFSFSRKAKKKA
ncbi:AAA family ATPase [Ferruginivarius sediminum]|uniref:Pilus assembly protein CpaE n=1 Tax=Ferruginivarius sediminum TaxID=2661937 RepID=A0A369TD00_9PROT|nr:AAA family ATPase [Ferruginivarius sediminum]RDD62692.1 pilus assembly protein CpaE [Ferruginivarius sediminum]